MKQFNEKYQKYGFLSILLVLLFSLGIMAGANGETPAQTHYTTVWQGENGQNHMNFVVVSAVLENIPLSAGDEIGVFSGSFCVGTKRLTQEINIANSSTFLTIPASQKDGSNNGFTDNDTILFKIWDHVNQNEMMVKAVTYLNNVPTWITSGRFKAESTAVVEIESYSGYFSSSADANSPQMNINLLGISESGLVIGDELGAFDGQICVGTIKISESVLSQDSARIIASSSTSVNIQNGFLNGHSIEIIAWNHVSGNEFQVQAEILDGQMKYATNSSVLVKLKSTATSATRLNDQVQIELFPNPAYGRFTVHLSQIPDHGSQIDIFDLSGRKVASREISGLAEGFNLENQLKGIYFVKFKIGAYEKTQKLIIR